jgi:hypothetical protein
VGGTVWKRYFYFTSQYWATSKHFNAELYIADKFSGRTIKIHQYMSINQMSFHSYALHVVMRIPCNRQDVYPSKKFNTTNPN